MKNIYVFLIGYSNSTILRRALMSLNLIDHRIEDIAILEESEQFITINDSSFSQKIKLIKLIHNDLGVTLNECIQKVSSEYILFLYDQQYFNNYIKDTILELHDSQHVMTYPYIVKDKVIHRPFFIKTSFLKQNSFFSKYQVPFREAVLPSWLSRLNKSSVVTASDNFISETSKHVPISLLQKLEFIEKYQHEKVQSLVEPSISVMIANYNMAEYVEIAINSCFLQSSPIDQILVIDDGSTDHSYKQLEKWNYAPNFRLLKKANGGKARALNDLIPYIQTKFVIELDADDWLDPNAISVIREFLAVLPEDVAVLYGNLKNWRQTSLDDIYYRTVKKGKPVKSSQELINYNFPLGPRIYRTSSLKESNGFPVFEFEDVAVLNKLLKNNRLLYQDFTVYNVREHRSSFTRKNKKNHPKWSDFKKYFS
ncbi:glycosyltransferase family 2 protein [Priestia aryabhattai]|uniref:glycosyltransferase family 2 protein n=1 Tax=Priestia aryabhattai TaxID=412384 RepID=UPI003735DE9F